MNPVSEPPPETPRTSRQAGRREDRQYFLKAHVQAVKDGQFRGYVEVSIRAGKDIIDHRLRYGPLIRDSWSTAMDDAERLAFEVRDADCADGPSHVFSVRGTGQFDALLNMFALH